jgi:hypothetical protein
MVAGGFKPHFPRENLFTAKKISLPGIKAFWSRFGN